MSRFLLNCNLKVELERRLDLPDACERRGVAPSWQALPATSVVGARLWAAVRPRRRTQLRPGCSSTPEPVEELQHWKSISPNRRFSTTAEHFHLFVWAGRGKEVSCMGEGHRGRCPLWLLLGWESREGNELFVLLFFRQQPVLVGVSLSLNWGEWEATVIHEFSF